MSDSYLHYSICAADRLPEDQGIHFLFHKPCRLSGEMLVSLGEDYERSDEILDFCSRRHFIRSF